MVQLLNEGFRVSIIDNLDNSVTEAVDRVRDLVGPKRSQNLEFHLVSSSFCVCKFLFCLVAEKMREEKVINYRFLNILSNAGFNFREISIFFKFFFLTVSWQPNSGLLRFLAFGKKAKIEKFIILLICN